MQIIKTSSFKDPKSGPEKIKSWNKSIQDMNGVHYEPLYVKTSLGNTHVLAYGRERKDVDTVVIFPGFRTCGLFWDLNNSLEEVRKKYRVFLVDINGQPSLSDGGTPAVASNEYGIWAQELLTGLGIEKAIVCGASHGGFVTLKLCTVAPQMVKHAILFGTAGIRNNSLAWKVMYPSVLPLISPSEKNIRLFLNRVVFHPPMHSLPENWMQAVVDYQQFALKEFNLKPQLPKPLSHSELNSISTPIHLVLGDKDMLYPFEGTVKIAKEQIKSLAGVHIFKDTGHGIETSKEAVRLISELAD